MAFDIEKVREAINDLSEWEQVELWNERCEDENYMDDYIYDNDPDELMCGQKPSDILSRVDMENYDLNSDWACYSIYGWVSFGWLSDKNSPFDIDELISWYCDNEGYEQTDLLDYEELIEDEEDEDFEEGFDFGDEDSIIYEVECACGEVINFDEETLEAGSMKCPNCGETLEFSFDDEDEE